jgi:hypothetical protein
VNNRTGYALAALVGAISGGVLVAVATRAVPKMMDGMMSRMRHKMVEHMRQSGINPAEM